MFSHWHFQVSTFSVARLEYKRQKDNPEHSPPWVCCVVRFLSGLLSLLSIFQFSYIFVFLLTHTPSRFLFVLREKNRENLHPLSSWKVHLVVSLNYQELSVPERKDYLIFTATQYLIAWMNDT